MGLVHKTDNKELTKKEKWFSQFLDIYFLVMRKKDPWGMLQSPVTSFVQNANNFTSFKTFHCCISIAVIVRTKKKYNNNIYTNTYHNKHNPPESGLSWLATMDFSLRWRLAHQWQVYATKGQTDRKGQWLAGGASGRLSGSVWLTQAAWFVYNNETKVWNWQRQSVQSRSSSRSSQCSFGETSRRAQILTLSLPSPGSTVLRRGQSSLCTASFWGAGSHPGSFGRFDRISQHGAWALDLPPRRGCKTETESGSCLNV